MTNNLELNSLWIILNLDDLDLKTVNSVTKAQVGGYYFDLAGTRQSVTISLPNVTPSNTLFPIPFTFYRTNFLSYNTFYKNPDLSTIGILTCPTNSQFCFDSQTPIRCAYNYYLSITDKKCQAACPSGLNIEYGSSMNEPNRYGDCILPCYDSNNTSNTSICLNNYLNYFNSFSCRSDMTEYHNSCITSTNDNNAGMLYSHYFGNLPRIKFDIQPAMNSYYLDLWYYADRFYVRNNVGLNPAKNYILYTNAFAIYKEGDYSITDNFYLEDNLGNKVSQAITFKYGNWYKLSFKVVQNGSYTGNFYYTQYANNIALNNPTSLSWILFCHGSCGAPVYNINWFSGFYKYLRIWNPTNLPDDFATRFDR